jgi:hypothetical protein
MEEPVPTLPGQAALCRYQCAYCHRQTWSLARAAVVWMPCPDCRVPGSRKGYVIGETPYHRVKGWVTYCAVQSVPVSHQRASTSAYGVGACWPTRFSHGARERSDAGRAAGDGNRHHRLR